ncbi:DUF357 domain-containing protein [Candidatus Pacearchaeota archaeon]|nr:DUF357 domain-containing protein [Candidatus Pacearchaeota archaeon]
MNNLITSSMLKKYREITKKALEIASKNVALQKEQDAMKILETAKNYLSDSDHFEKKQDFVNAFGSIYYAHGWLDSGARLGIFNVKNSALFAA